jgi:hypothetical protein
VLPAGKHRHQVRRVDVRGSGEDLWIMVTSSVGADFFSVCAPIPAAPQDPSGDLGRQTRGFAQPIPSGSCARHGPCGPVGRATVVRISSRLPPLRAPGPSRFSSPVVRPVARGRPSRAGRPG